MEYSSDDSDYSAFLSDYFEHKDDVGEWDEENNLCVSDMMGNHILPVNSLCQTLCKNICCRIYAVHNHWQQVKLFLTFAREYKEKSRWKKETPSSEAGWKD